jgi:predicted secreted acid phosphatase
MHGRLTLGTIAAVALLPAPAGAATTRTDQTPDQIRAVYASGEIDREIAAVYKRATKYLRDELERRRRTIRRPAVVLDIDETTMSNYPCLDAANFDLSGLATCAVEGRSAAIGPARRFVRYARDKGVRVVFITGSPESICDIRAANLRAVGIPARNEVVCRPPDDTAASAVPYKSGARKDLQQRGLVILANIGDQRSDLAGGAARKAFKLPNPIYFTD